MGQRRVSLRGLWAVCGLMWSMASCVAAEARPNVLLLITDDQGYGDLSCHGNPILKTPNLDRLWSESVRFTDFHVSPTCAPTRAALLTGRHEFRSGVTHTIFERERLSLKATVFPQLMQAAGYRTGIFGKWHLGDEDPYQPQRRGFDEAFIHGGGGIGQSYAGSCGDAPGNKYFNPVIRHNGRFEATQGYCTNVFFDKARVWMSSLAEDQPFYCQVATNAPHSPLVVDDRYAAMYRGQVSDEVAQFYGMITNLDEQVGQLLDWLKGTGRDRNTMVVFMTDNGSAHGSGTYAAGMRAAKGTPYRGGTRVPLFVRWPGQFKPRDVDALTAHYDVFPTLCELTGTPIPEVTQRLLEGRSLTPWLKGETPAWPDRALVTHVGRWPVEGPPHKSGPARVRWKTYHWVNHPAKGTMPDAWKLYDLAADPAETTDVAAAHPEAVAQMTSVYEAWWESILPELVNEDKLQHAPPYNPFHVAYWRQYRGAGPNNVAPPAAIEAILDRPVPPVGTP